MRSHSDESIFLLTNHTPSLYRMNFILMPPSISVANVSLLLKFTVRMAASTPAAGTLVRSRRIGICLEESLRDGVEI
jgi:hypothetical protein